MLPGGFLGKTFLRLQPAYSPLARRASRIVSSDFPQVSIPDVLIHEMVLENVPKWADFTAMVDVVSGRRYSFRQLDDLSRRVGAGYLRSGLKPGQVVSLVLPNMPEFIIATLGAFRAGLVVTTINPLYGPDEILHQVRDSDAALLITYPDKVGDVQAALGKLPGPRPHVGVVHRPSDGPPPGTRSFLELFNSSDTSAIDQVKMDQESLALLLYSSGTTGLPKGVCLTHRNIVSNITQIDGDLMPVLPTKKDHQDVASCILPFFHVYGLVIGAFCYLARGVKLVTLPKFDKDLFIKALTTHKTSVVSMVPPLIQFMANHPEIKASTLDSLRVVLNGAAALSPTDANRLLEKKKNISISSGYGLTESSPVITAAKAGQTDLDSVGHLIPNTQMKMIDIESGEIVDPGTPGEICARGPQVMKGYHKNEEATSKTVIDGWLHTGDVGFIKDGKLFIVDRIKELIKVKGFQVAPMELEELLRSHPGVADVGVVGKPDPRLGESPVAFVVPTSKKPSVSELKEFVASKVAEYKQLSDIIFLDEIPKSLTGKILRRKLKENLLKS